MEREKIKIGWEEFHRDCIKLAEKLKPLGPFKAIGAVTRGGLIPATIVAMELDMRLIDTICVASYDGMHQGEICLLKEISSSHRDQILVIDDLVDTGKTAIFIKEQMPDAFLATVYTKSSGAALSDLYVRNFPQDTWLEFPWECRPC